MAIPSGAIALYDYLDPVCYPGSGLTINDKVVSGFALTCDSTTAATYNSTFGTFSLGVGNPVGAPNYFIRSTTGNYINTGQTDFTINAWFNITSFSAKPPYTFIWLNGNRQGAYEGYGLNILGGSNAINITIPGIADIGTGFVPALNTWYLASLVVGSSNNYTLYINGSSVNTGTFNTPIAHTASSQFAIGYPASSLNDEVFNGVSAYISAYDSVLTAGQILDIYNATKDRYLPTPLVSYDFSDPSCYSGSGNTAFDLSGNNHNLNLFNSPTLGGTGQSKYLQCTSAYLAEQYGQSTAINTTNVQITLNTWVASIGPGVFDIFDCLHFFGKPSLAQYYATWGQYAGVYQYIAEMSTAASQINSGIATSSTFKNVIASIGATTLTLYIDGVGVGSTSHSLGPWDSDAVIQLNGYPAGGYSRSGNYQFGLHQVYDSSFNSTQVTNLYNSQESRFSAGPPPPPPPPPPPLSSPGPIGGRRFGGRFNG
jgi:hypothetical protein